MNAASNNLLAFVRSLSQIATYVEQDVEILTEDLRVLVVKATVCIVEQYAEITMNVPLTMEVAVKSVLTLLEDIIALARGVFAS